MNNLAKVPDERVAGVRCDADRLIVDLADGRTIAAPLAWYPRLLNATPEQRANWEVAGAGFGIHWPDVDEDLSIAGLLRGTPAPGVRRYRRPESGDTWHWRADCPWWPEGDFEERIARPGVGMMCNTCRSIETEAAGSPS